VRDRDALHLAAQDFLQFTGQKIDVVIASAGISAGTLTEEAEDFAVFKAIVDTNLLAMVATFEPFIGTMKAAGKGSLVGIASVAGIRGLPGAGAYSSSKAAVIAYCESLRLELSLYGVSVVTITPGYIRTAMTAHNPYSMPFLMPAEDFARKARKTIEQGVSYRVIPWQMGLVSRLMRLLPNWLYDRLARQAPRKPRLNKKS
jgi:short-subunit dehydrogenase